MMKKRASVVAIKTVTSRPVLFLWTSVSLMVALLCCWSYSQPAWTLRTSSEISSLDYNAASGNSQVSEVVVVEAVRSSRIERAVSIQLPADEIIADLEPNAVNGSDAVIPGRSAIPLVHIGLFGMCIYTQHRPDRRPDSTVTCVSHADLEYEWLPPAWQVTRVVCGCACVMLLLCALASLAASFIRQHHRQQRFIKLTAIAQLAAASLMLLGLGFYPFGLRSENLHHFCDQRCQPGWSSLVAGLSSAAAFLCPVLATLVANPIYDHNPWEAYLLL